MGDKGSDILPLFFAAAAIERIVGTITLEMVEQEPELDVMVIAVGGGSQAVGALTVLSIGLILFARTEVQIADNYKTHTGALYVAEAGVAEDGDAFRISFSR